MKNKAHGTRLLLCTISIAFAICIAFSASADGDLGSDPYSLWDSNNPDQQDFNNIIDSMRNGLDPAWPQIEAALLGWVEHQYQWAVDLGSTAYDEGYRVEVDYLIDGMIYSDVYIIYNNNGVIDAGLISHGMKT